jgi:hypothetical protein
MGMRIRAQGSGAVQYNNRSEVVSGCVWDVWADATNASGLPGTYGQAGGPGHGDVEVCQRFNAGVSALVTVACSTLRATGPALDADDSSSPPSASFAGALIGRRAKAVAA